MCVYVSNESGVKCLWVSVLLYDSSLAGAAAAAADRHWLRVDKKEM